MSFISFFLVTLTCYVSFVVNEIYFHEDFKNEFDGWVFPESSSKTYGKLQRVEIPGSNPSHYAIETTLPSHFYAAIKKFPQDISSTEQDLSYVLGLKASTTKGCGGNYIKILPQIDDLKSFHADSPYNIMFGPDKCGSKSIIHVIINHNNINHELSVPIQHTFSDYYQIFRLDIFKDKTFKVYVDSEEVKSGSILKDFNIIPPKKINDPSVTKPANWDDRQKIDDPKDKKPSDWDQPEYIPDSSASKPTDWNDEDGEWIPDNVKNPAFKGEWIPRKIDNPEYQGEWQHPLIDNPAYDDKIEKVVGHFTHSAIAIDWWEVESGDIVSDFAVGTVDSIEKLADDLVIKANLYKKYQDEQKLKQEKEEKNVEKDTDKSDEQQSIRDDENDHDHSDEL